MPVPAAWGRSTRNLQLVAVVSKDLAIDPSCTYTEIGYVVEFGSTMNFVGGINKPKLVRLGLPSS